MYGISMHMTLLLSFHLILTAFNWQCIVEDCHDVALEYFWFARQQLFFKCCWRPKHGRMPKNSTYKAGPGMYKYIPVYIIVCTLLTISHQMFS